VQKQAVSLGQGAPAAIAILLLLFILLAFEIVPALIAAVICATIMIVTRVLTLSRLYGGIDWNTWILIGAMTPPAIAMTQTGAAALIVQLSQLGQLHVARWRAKSIFTLRRPYSQWW
jgi:di/tricarboxylate transporter